MLHIHSHDVDVGATFNGNWKLNRSLKGNLQLRDSYIETGDIPFIYSGCNEIFLRRSSDDSTHTASMAQTEDEATANVAGVIETAFQAIAFLAATTVVYNAGTDNYDITFPEDVDLIWGSSSARFSLDQNPVTVSAVSIYSVPRSHLRSRPKYLEVFISEVSTTGVSTHLTSPTLVVPTFDSGISGTVLSLIGSHNSFNISWRKINVPNVSVPLSLQWDLVLSFV